MRCYSLALHVALLARLHERDTTCRDDEGNVYERVPLSEMHERGWHELTKAQLEHVVWDGGGP